MQNLHTHTTLSDGIDTPEAMINHAIMQGLSEIGISDHAKTDFLLSYEPDTDKYLDTIRPLKEKYKDKIEVFLGLEMDYYSKGHADPRDFDYVIGSVHLFKGKDGKMISYDSDPEKSIRFIKEDFGGDPYKYARAYFDNVADLVNRFDFDIVGHFDVLTKYVEKYDCFFDTGSLVYQNMALEALHAVREKREIFEMNTGAISRGWRTSPYPESFLLKEMRRLDCKMILSSDCHNGKYLTCHFNEARELLKAAGFTEIYEFKNGAFVGEKI